MIFYSGMVYYKSGHGDRHW